jgi:hypothetical protein
MTREAFEAHIRKKFPTAKEELLFSRSSIGRYRSIATEDAWLAWQAATAAALERAAVACEVIENDRWALYKGRPPYTGAEPGRADNYVQGESGGAGLCAEAIRALKEQP